MDSATQRRNYFRVHYTSKDCPFFRFQAYNFQVLDISEEGFKFQMSNPSVLQVDMEVSGSMNFRDGESFLVHGQVRRISQNEVSVKLKKPLPLRKITAEQMLLIKKQKDAS